MTDPFALLAFGVLFVSLLFGLCLSYAVGADARARGSNGVLWAVFTVVLFFVAVPVYLAYRTVRLGNRAEPPSSVERYAGAFGIGGVAAWTTSGLVAPPDPLTQVFAVVPLLLVLVPAAFVLCYEPGWRALVGRRSENG